MSENTSIGSGRTLLVALLVSLICSAAVSLVSTQLREAQQLNVENHKNQSILAAVGLLPEDGDTARAFAAMQVRQVRLDTGEIVVGEIPKAERESRVEILAEQDIARLRSRENYATVYFLGSPDNFEALVLPVRGYALWGTIYGYLALDWSLQRVVGIEFYEHKETAGLGAAVDNPNWKAQWHGKQLYDKDGQMALQVIKGRVPQGAPDAVHQVDGLAGATLTGRGISSLLIFWLGESGYGPLLARLKGQNTGGGQELSGRKNG